MAACAAVNCGGTPSTIGAGFATSLGFRTSLTGGGCSAAPGVPSPDIGEGEDRARIFHFGGCAGVCRPGNATGIGCNIDRPAIRAHSRVPKPVFRLEVARKMAGRRLPVGD